MELYPSARSLSKIYFVDTRKKLLTEKSKLRNFPYVAISMKTRVCLKYFVNYCSFGRWSFQYIASYLTDSFLFSCGSLLLYHIIKAL